jgi:hypothetical protein
MTKTPVFVLLGLLGAACSGGSPTSTPPAPTLAVTDVVVTPAQDSAVVSLKVNMPAQVRLTYVRAGRTDTTYTSGSASATTSFVLKPLAPGSLYHLLLRASAGPLATAHPAMPFMTLGNPDPCVLGGIVGLQPIDLRFEFRPQPNPDLSLIVEYVDAANCDGSTIATRDQIVSVDGGQSFSRIYKAKPNLPGGSKQLSIRAGIFRPTGFVRWLAPHEITLNGKTPTRVTEIRPAPPTCSSCPPGPAVAFDVNSNGVVDP